MDCKYIGEYDLANKLSELYCVFITSTGYEICL
jgi:hypothetical protein